MEHAEKKPKKYMVAVDGSPSAEHAFEFLMRHANLDDNLIIVTAIRKKYPNLTPEITQDTDKLAAEKRRVKELNHKATQEGVAILEKYDQLCKRAHRRCTFSTVKYRESGGSSSIGEELCRAADNTKVESLTVGSRGLSGLRRMMLGSVSEYIVRNCHCNVTVVKKPPP